MLLDELGEVFPGQVRETVGNLRQELEIGADWIKMEMIQKDRGGLRIPIQ